MYSNTEYPCQDCPGGQYSGTEGANGCTKCSVGSYQGDTGALLQRYIFSGFNINCFGQVRAQTLS